jgi:hypothetical protein
MPVGQGALKKALNPRSSITTAQFDKWREPPCAELGHRERHAVVSRGVGAFERMAPWGSRLGDLFQQSWSW